MFGAIEKWRLNHIEAMYVHAVSRAWRCYARDLEEAFSNRESAKSLPVSTALLGYGKIRRGKWKSESS